MRSQKYFFPFVTIPLLLKLLHKSFKFDNCKMLLYNRLLLLSKEKKDECAGTVYGVQVGRLSLFGTNRFYG